MVGNISELKRFQRDSLQSNLTDVRKLFFRVPGLLAVEGSGKRAGWVLPLGQREKTFQGRRGKFQKWLCKKCTCECFPLLAVPLPVAGTWSFPKFLVTLIHNL